MFLRVTRTSLVVDVPLLDAGQAVGVGAGQDDVGLSLEADAALVQRIRVDVARQLSIFLSQIKHSRGGLSFSGLEQALV